MIKVTMDKAALLNTAAAKHIVYYILFLLSANFSFSQAPVITSFAPETGVVGTTVTITGNNFSVVPANNIVYFDAVKAIVNTASATSLTVTVPAGAKFGPITVTNNALTAYSLKFFIPTFTGGAVLTTKSYVQKVNIFSSLSSDNLVVHDFDGDGKPDVVSADDSLVILRNTSTPNNLSFAAPVIYGAVGHYTIKVATGDIDGDGKQDIITGSGGFGNYKLSVFKNTSIPGSISFTQVNFISNQFISNIVISDFDGDGKPDIITSLLTANKLRIFRNTTTGGLISLAQIGDYSLPGTSGYNLCAGDIDGDGKPDIVTSSGGSGKVWLTRNTSTPGTISFAAATFIAIPGYDTYTGIADFDGDGKLDIVAEYNRNQFSIYKNASTPGSFVFSSSTNFGLDGSALRFSIGEVDGDGKPDVTIVNGNSNTVRVYKNLSSPGNIFLANSGGNNWSEYNMLDIENCDMDGDGKTDIVLMNISLSVLRNVVNEPIITSIAPADASAGTTITITGFAFTGTTAVNFSNIPAASYTVVNDTSVIAVLAADFAGSVAVTNAHGTGTLDSQFLPPVISTVLPYSGAIGSVTTIKGHNFNTIKERNTVYFGAVKATVTAATDSALQVIVPAGAIYDLVSVTNHFLTAYSSKPFATTFTGGDTIINAISFETPRNYVLGRYPENIVINDVNGDGKPDLAVSTLDSPVILKNNSNSGNISFTKVADNASFQYRYWLGDIDGDGRFDKVYSGGGGPVTNIRICRNTSTTNTASFGREVTLVNREPYLQSAFYSVPAIGDMNGDGKPEIISGNNNTSSSTAGSITIWQNINEGGLIKMVPVSGIPAGTYTGSIRRADLDGDGLIDVLTLKNSFSNGFTVLRNRSDNNGFAFDFHQDYFMTNPPYDYAVGDIDGDGKPDVLLTNLYDNNFSLFKNTSVAGSISFAPKIDFTAGNGPYGIAIADVNGDNKQDVVITNSTDSSFSIFKNTSAAGIISFAPKVNYTTLPQPRFIAIGDLDLDSLPDIAITNYEVHSVSIFRNRQGRAYNLELCNPVGNTSLQSSLTGIVYQWQVSTDSINFTDITNNTNYAGANTAILNLTGIPSSWYGRQYRCVVDGNNSVVATIKFVNRWTGAVNNQWENPANWSCGTVPDSNTDVIISSGTVLLNTNTTIRSLTLQPGVSFMVLAGVILTIMY